MASWADLPTVWVVNLEATVVLTDSTAAWPSGTVLECKLLVLGSHLLECQINQNTRQKTRGQKGHNQIVVNVYWSYREKHGQLGMHLKCGLSGVMTIWGELCHLTGDGDGCSMEADRQKTYTSSLPFNVCLRVQFLLLVIHSHNLSLRCSGCNSPLWLISRALHLLYLIINNKEAFKHEGVRQCLTWFALNLLATAMSDLGVRSDLQSSISNSQGIRSSSAFDFALHLIWWC